jgi:hypothetical protein
MESGLGDAGVTWEGFGRAVGAVLGAILTTITTVIGVVSEMALAIADVVEVVRIGLKEEEEFGLTAEEARIIGAARARQRERERERARVPVPIAPTPVTPVAGVPGAVAGQQVKIDVQPPPPPTVKTTVPIRVQTTLQIDSAKVAEHVEVKQTEQETRGGPTSPAP